MAEKESEIFSALYSLTSHAVMADTMLAVNVLLLHGPINNRYQAFSTISKFPNSRLICKLRKEELENGDHNCKFEDITSRPSIIQMLSSQLTLTSIFTSPLLPADSFVLNNLHSASFKATSSKPFFQNCKQFKACNQRLNIATSDFGQSNNGQLGWKKITTTTSAS